MVLLQLAGGKFIILNEGRNYFEGCNCIDISTGEGQGLDSSFEMLSWCEIVSNRPEEGPTPSRTRAQTLGHAQQLPKERNSVCL